MNYTIEKMKGNVKLTEFTLFIEDIEDMDFLEFWEERLNNLKEEYAVAYKTTKLGKIVYSIFCNTAKRGSSFK